MKTTFTTPDAAFNAMNEWLLAAIFEGKVEMPDAQSRMRAIQRAQREGLPIPDIRVEGPVSPDYHWLPDPGRLEDSAPDGKRVRDDPASLIRISARLSYYVAKKQGENLDKLHWRTPAVPTSYLVGRLKEEVEELLAAVEAAEASPSSDTAGAAWDEVADVALFAAYLADRLR